jgi:hypothetical protein
METKEKKQRVPRKRAKKEEKDVETAMLSPYSRAQIAYMRTSKLLDAGSQS